MRRFLGTFLAVVAVPLVLTGVVVAYQSLDLSPVDPFTCNPSTEGATYQNTTSHTAKYCNGTAWTDLGGSVFGSPPITMNIGQIPKATTTGGGGLPIQLGGSIISDNGTTARVSGTLDVFHGGFGNPIFVGNQDGIKVVSIEAGGSLWAANTKTLAESSATAFARLTIASGSSGGANIDYCIEANDSTDFQSRCGMLPVAVVNKAGTITCTVGTVAASTEVVAASAGTLTNTFTCADSGTNFLDIKANATSSLTQTTLRINYFVRQQGNTAVAFTPQ